MKFFIYTDLPKKLQSRLKSALGDYGELIFRTELSDNAINEFQAATILFGNAPKNWFTPLPDNLKFWQLDSAGFDQYADVKVNAVVANMGDFFSIMCAETMVAGILAYYRHIHDLVRFQSEKRWVGKPLRYKLELLSRKKVIILGAGTIALCIEKLLTGFECEVKMTARTNAKAQIRSTEELMQALPAADLIINTLPGKANQYVNETFFNSMVEGSVYASIGRGNTTDEKALLRALESRRLAGAILDVTEQEPLPDSSQLWAMNNVILTQHTGGGHKMEDEGKADLFIENARRFLDGEKIKNQVDLAAGY
ncbi:MAG TPA: D-2-hydroxyacid dehydrogenase [Ohtaekwangia sp.]|nr:D-2-hydroxyacid dehydrogenase [Ohtaekwangia sp.]